MILHEHVVASTESNGERTILKTSSDVFHSTTIVGQVVDGIDLSSGGVWVGSAVQTGVIAIVRLVWVLCSCIDTILAGVFEEPLLPTTVVA